jgi:hypothetical protein
VVTFVALVSLIVLVLAVLVNDFLPMPPFLAAAAVLPFLLFAIFGVLKNLNRSIQTTSNKQKIN